jgi:hypothetical protein
LVKLKGMDILTSTKTGTDGMYEPSPIPNQNTYRMNGNTWILQDYPDIDIIKGFSSSSSSSSSEQPPPKILLTHNEPSSAAAAASTTATATILLMVMIF